MNRTEYLLTQAASECTEVAHRITKALHFGLDEVQPGQPGEPESNAERIVGEYIDLLAAVDRKPGRILVVSDGEPDSESAALSAAASFDGVIDVLYIGPDSNSLAMRFLRALAKAGHGRYHGSDISKAGQPALAHTVQQLLLAAA